MTRKITTIVPLLLLIGCGGSLSDAEIRSTRDKVVAAINEARVEAELEPLQEHQILNTTATELARLGSKGRAPKSGEDRLPVLISEGAFARFSLYHLGKAESVEDIAKALTGNTEAQAKILHVNVSHVGIGVISGAGSVHAALDLARLVPTVDKTTGLTELKERIQTTRKNNSVGAIEFKANLDEQAAEIAESFINGAGTSEELINAAQQRLGSATFAIGRVTITFQVVGALGTMVIPSITSNPKVAYAGLGIAQGNHPEHEPGSLAIALLLAESQTAHDVERYESDLPPPKSAPDNAKSKGSAVDRAWVATLVGNHKKAAKLFLEAFRKKKTPSLLYEAARAYARDGNKKAALKHMKEYAALAEGEEKAAAEEKVALLEKGESIFATSEKQKMSVEAERFFAMGRRLFEQKEWDGAIDAFQQAYVYTKHPDIIYNIGLVHSRAGRVGEALHFFGEYQKAIPEAGNADEAKQLFEIGVELFKAGQFEAASKNFAMSYAFIPFPHLIYNLALCHKAMGQNEEALRFLREYLDTDPPSKERKEVQKMISELSAGLPPTDAPDE